MIDFHNSFWKLNVILFFLSFFRTKVKMRPPIATYLLLALLPFLFTLSYFQMERPWNQGLYLISRPVMLFVAFKFMSRESWKSLFQRFFSFESVLVTFLFVLSFLGLSLFVLERLQENTLLLDQVSFFIRKKLTQFDITTPQSFFIFALLLSLFHSAFEEIYWRLFLLPRFMTSLGSVGGTLLLSFLFTLHHFVPLMAFIPHELFLSHILPAASLTGLGALFWSWHWIKYEEALTLWIGHVFVDLILMGGAWIVMSST